MFTILRDAPVGSLLRLINSNNKLLYIDELQDPIQFYDYQDLSDKDECFRSDHTKAGRKKTGTPEILNQQVSNVSAESPRPLILDTSSRNPGLVDWYGDNDPENPVNFSSSKKAWITFIICLYTFIVYCGSAIFVPSFAAIMQRYQVSQTLASLGLALYVFGYGLGPLLFSPLSEIDRIGRNPPYIVPFIAFLVVSIAAAVVDSFAGLMVLRFWQGFLGSPCLASGAASLQDIYSWQEVPYAFIFWVAAVYCGPALGPLLAGYTVETNWRWPLWEIVIMAGFLLFLMAFTLPETAPATILHYRARRLRHRYSSDFRTRRELEKHTDLAALIQDALTKPIEIAIKDPAMAFASVYISVIYLTYYSYFEAFPIVYMETYEMSLGQFGLIFLTILVGCVVGAISYSAYLYFIFWPRNRASSTATNLPPEDRLVSALVGVFFLPIGILIFAWTARTSIHWIVPTVGISIFAASSFIVVQCIFIYVSLAYPRYTASLFACNDFLRSTVAAGAVMYSRAMYVNLGIARGASLLAGLTGMGIVGIWILYLYGARMRARSKFATK